MRDSWMNAEMAVQNGQSYSIGNRSLTKANLSDIREAIQYWDRQATKAQRKQKGRGSARIKFVVPMD